MVSRQKSKPAFWLHFLPGALKIRQESIYLSRALFLMRFLKKKYKQVVHQLILTLVRGLQTVPSGSQAARVPPSGPGISPRGRVCGQEHAVDALPLTKGAGPRLPPAWYPLGEAGGSCHCVWVRVGIIYNQGIRTHWGGTTFFLEIERTEPQRLPAPQPPSSDARRTSRVPGQHLSPLLSVHQAPRRGAAPGAPPDAPVPPDPTSAWRRATFPSGK